MFLRLVMPASAVIVSLCGLADFPRHSFGPDAFLSRDSDGGGCSCWLTGLTLLVAFGAGLRLSALNVEYRDVRYV
jgi:hypothetical protein